MPFKINVWRYVKVAAAEGDGDSTAAAAVACPAGLLPTPHIALGR